MISKFVWIAKTVYIILKEIAYILSKLALIEIAYQQGLTVKLLSIPLSTLMILDS